MAVFEHSFVVDATLDRVRELHASGAGLRKLTPSVADLRVEAVRGGDPDAPLPEGAEIDVSTRGPLPGTRRRWTSAVTRAERDADAALFVDAMRDGPFPRWEHVHRFEAVEGGTRVVDRIEYRLPSPAGPASPLAAVGLEPLFRYRERRTRQLLES